MKGFSNFGLILFFAVFFNTACSSSEVEGEVVTQPPVKGAQVGFYLVSDTTDVDSEPKLVSYMGQSLQLKQPAIIGNEDIASVKPHSPTSLLLQLTPAGGEKLFAATSHHIGNRMLIMLDEEVVNVATIQMGLGGSMVITGLNEKLISHLLLSFGD
ncbi:hypothetical protein Ssed_3357 [Shewanella sediminis HAW-EB3]|uniref:SecDF P1 head subdomain domain-containing protein n=1 Tax=Shewanella sediminis (strain HAW-EB3) TaxID=425104 RepID=A8FYN8_SHESH|nr:hypothetical protein [Shewanella sediminis]ABV37961.1 hypothetical protein Ssed_3357 [Shewanella sediminis HAW-EB3]